MRWKKVWVISLAALAWGCSSNKPDYREKEPFTTEVWRQSIQIDEQRKISETTLNHQGWHPTDKLLAGTWDTILRMYYWISGDSPFNAAKALIDPREPDKRRKAVIYLSKREWGREKPYIDYYVDMAKSDPEYLVRAIALRALNRSRDAEQSALYIKSLDDKNEFVRLEAAKALANMPAEKAYEPLTAHLKDINENIDVRIACADALRNYHKKEAALALVSQLKDRNFSIVWQARWALKLMTGRDFNYNATQWLDFLSATDNPFPS
jgi:hypothetical protein